MSEWQWLIGISLTVLVPTAGMLAAAYYRLSDHQRAGHRELHRRIDTMRDEYVKRTDLDSHLARLERQQQDMRAEAREFRNEMKDQHRETQRRLDAIMGSMGHSPPSHQGHNR